MSEKYTVVHKKSKVLVEGQPKLPSASTIEYGEIAINYADGHETLSIKNSSDKIATFSSDSTVNASLSEIRDDIADIQSAMTEDELVIATSLNDLNDRIDNINVPQNTSDLTNDSGFITGYTETDPTVPSWAKAASKPTYTAAEVGAMATSERSNYATTAHTHTAEEVGAMATSERSNYSTTAHTHSQYATTAHTHTAAEVGAMATSERSNYSTTAHTHTAEEVGAMATSERSNYLTTATTIPNVDNYFDSVEYDSNSKRINFKHGATVKGYVDASSFIKDGMVSSVTVSNGNLVVTFNTEAGREDITLALTEIFNPNNYYTKTDADGKFLTGYTETDPTVPAWAKAASKPSYTAAEVGAMATSERSNYSTTAHTHTAAEVGAMATSERNNYLTTATTIPTTAAEVGAMATSERSNYSTTGHTHSQYATTADTANFITSADTGWFFVRLANSYRSSCKSTNGAALPSGTYNSIANALSNGQVPVVIFEDTNIGYSVPYYCAMDVRYDGDINFFAFPNDTEPMKHEWLRILENDNGRIKSYDIGSSSSGSGLPAVTAADNGKILQVVNGAWAVVMPTTVYTGTDTPLSSIGNDGDIYLQTS